MAWASTSRYWPMVTSVRISSKTGRARCTWYGSSPALCSSWSDQTRHRSPRRIGGRVTEPVGVAAPAGGAVVGGEPAVHGGLAPAGVGAVHQVVVDERAGLDELQGGEGRHQLIGVDAAGAPVAPVGEGRAQPLAAAQHECLQRLGHRQQGVVGGGQPGALSGEEVGQRLVDPAPEASAVHGRYGGGIGHALTLAARGAARRRAPVAGRRSGAGGRSRAAAVAPPTTREAAGPRCRRRPAGYAPECASSPHR